MIAPQKILVTGYSGQVAISLRQEAAQRKTGIDLHCVGRDRLDLNNLDSIAPFVAELAPDIIVNAAAWTAVDDAEDKPELAFRLNADAPGILAAAARDCSAKLIHLSTDYVYDGNKTSAYKEDDPTAPQSVYGESKLRGEDNIRAQFDEFVILRTAWVYGAYGNNFVKTMLQLSKTHKQLTVVDDQFGNPTSSHAIASAIFDIIDRWNDGSNNPNGEVYNCSGQGRVNWAGFARAIFQTAAEQGFGGENIDTIEVQGIPSSQWPAKAHRPANSELDCAKLNDEYSIYLPHWRDSLKETIAQLVLENV